MPLSNQQLQDIIAKAIGAGAPQLPKVESTIDKVIPLPMGSKSIIGILGALFGAGVMQSGTFAADPNIQQWVELATVAFGALGSAGVLAKIDRFLQISLKALSYAPEITALLEKLTAQVEEAAKNRGES
jgi:hypothetical protein